MRRWISVSERLSNSAASVRVRSVVSMPVAPMNSTLPSSSVTGEIVKSHIRSLPSAAR